MTDERLLGVNYDAAVDSDDLAYDQEAREAQFLERLRVVMGTYLRTMDPGYGIVAETDPTLATTTSAEPFVVKANTLAPTVQIDVLAGTAVTPAGFIINVPTTIEGIALAEAQINAINVVVLEYDTELYNNKLTRYNTLVGSRRRVVSSTNLIKVVSLADYENSTIFTSTRLEDCVVLAVVTVEQVTAGTQLVIDMTQSSYSFVRSWFTPIDIQHRQYLGTGTQSAENIHAMGINDLSAAGLTFMQLLAEHGVVVSRDQSMPMVPGLITTQTFDEVEFQQDTHGSITGSIGAWYVELDHFPIRLGAVINTDSITDHLAGRVVPHTNIVYFMANEPLFNMVSGTAPSIVVVYSYVKAAEPPVDVGYPELTFSQPTSGQELLIAGGLAYNALSLTDVSFEEYGQIPRRAIVYARADATDGIVLDKTPQVLQPQTSATTLGTVQDVTIPMLGNARLRVWLTNAIAGSATFAVDVELVGVDSAGNNLTETISFDSTYKDYVVPICLEHNDQFKLSNYVWSALSTLQVTSRTDDGPDTEVLVEALIEPVTSSDLDDGLPVAQVIWDGLRICAIEDMRPVNRIARKPTRFDNIGVANEAMLLNFGIIPIATEAETLAVEDFNDMEYSNLVVQDSPYGGHTTGCSTRILKFTDGLTHSEVPPHPTSATSVERGVYWTRAIPIEGDYSQIEVLPLGEEVIHEIQWRYTLKSAPDVWIPAPMTPIPMGVILQDVNGRWVGTAGLLNYIFKVEVRIIGDLTGFILMAHNGQITSLVIAGDLTVQGCVITDCIHDYTVATTLNIYTSDALSNIQIAPSKGASLALFASYYVWGNWGWSATLPCLFDMLSTTNAGIEFTNSLFAGGAGEFILKFLTTAGAAARIDSELDLTIETDDNLDLQVNATGSGSVSMNAETGSINLSYNSAGDEYVSIYNIGAGGVGLKLNSTDTPNIFLTPGGAPYLVDSAITAPFEIQLDGGAASDCCLRVYDVNSATRGHIESRAGFSCGDGAIPIAGERLMWDIVYGTLSGTSGTEIILYTPPWAFASYTIIPIASLDKLGPSMVIGPGCMDAGGISQEMTVMLDYNGALPWDLYLYYDTANTAVGDEYAICVFYVKRD